MPTGAKSAKGGEYAMSPEEVRAAVGYHNWFHVGVHEAVAKVQARCPEGWEAGYANRDTSPLPAGAVRVGQVKVRTGDPSRPLYVYPRAPMT